MPSIEHNLLKINIFASYSSQNNSVTSFSLHVSISAIIEYICGRMFYKSFTEVLQEFYGVWRRH